jgi:hypothetical protein
MNDMTMLFMYIQLAYPSFKSDLTEAKRSVDIGAEASLLQSIHDVCEFFIPTVHLSINVIIIYD